MGNRVYIRMLRDIPRGPAGHHGLSEIDADWRARNKGKGPIPGWRVCTANYVGGCSGCGMGIAIGDRIQIRHGFKARHLLC
jgi:hypothetical protein